jgi:hypothetical protein
VSEKSALKMGKNKMYDDEWQKPDWDKWSQIPKACLWQAISLSCDVEPNSLWDCVLSSKRQSSEYKGRAMIPDYHIIKYFYKGEKWERLPLDFRKRMEIAVGNVGKTLIVDGRLVESCQVSLSNFAAWAEKLGWHLPEQFPRKPILPVAKEAHQPSWPWGTYETKLLRDLAAAAEHFWKTYDPKHPEKAPTNETVSDWLVKECSVSKRNADAMATILRFDDLPTGARKTPQK